MFYVDGIMAIDPRITSVHVEGQLEKPALESGEVIITCFVSWGDPDHYMRREALNVRVWQWIEANKMATERVELRFVENFG
jgi:hypothetical protein